MVQGQFLPEAWGFAMACHGLPDLVFFFFFFFFFFFVGVGGGGAFFSYLK